MRTQGPPSEIRRLLSPFVRLVDGAWQRMHWWIATMAVLYLLSGITVVKSDEVAMILRWGRLVGDTPALQQHAAGSALRAAAPDRSGDSRSDQEGSRSARQHAGVRRRQRRAEDEEEDASVRKRSTRYARATR